MLTLDGVEPPRERGTVTRKLSFLKPYGVGLGSALRLYLAGWATWAGRAQIVQLSKQFGYDHVARVKPELPAVAMESLTPDSTPVQLWGQSVDGNVTDRELLAIARIVAANKAKNVFEFGTFNGRTTINLAMNAGPDARVVTIDLPAEQAGSTLSPLARHETQFAMKPISGERFLGTAAEKQITQVYADSGSFDFSPFARTMDFVFVDGSHAYEYVVNDSLQALAMLRGRGTIVWHDYAAWDGVTSALNSLRRARAEFRDVVWIEGTTLAVLSV